jgi:hypothetical protein
VKALRAWVKQYDSLEDSNGALVVTLTMLDTEETRAALDRAVSPAGKGYALVLLKDPGDE